MSARSRHKLLVFYVVVQISTQVLFPKDWELGNTSFVRKRHPGFVRFRVAVRRRRIDLILAWGRWSNRHVTLQVGHRNFTVLGKKSRVLIVDIWAGGLFAQILDLTDESILVTLILAQVNPINFLFISFVSSVSIWGHRLFFWLEYPVDVRNPLIFTKFLAYFSWHFVRDFVWTIDSRCRVWFLRLFTISENFIDIGVLIWFFLNPLSLVATSLIEVMLRIRYHIIGYTAIILSPAACIQCNLLNRDQAFVIIWLYLG